MVDCRVFHHDKCFDGACSASLFTRFYEQCIGPAEFSYHGLVHRSGDVFDGHAFGSGENAIVDFKYSTSPKVTWWFDHHLSAFMTQADHDDFLRHQAAQENGDEPMRMFYDADSISCTSLIADVAAERFHFDVKPYAELIHWANIVDGARYESAQAAVEMREPAMQLTMIIESSGDGVVPRIIPLLTTMSLADVLAQPFLQQLAGPLMERHRAGIDLIRQRADVSCGVLTFDITEQQTEGYSKFIPYYLHPDATYVVGLSRSSFRTKISVGTNPWTPKPASELINLAAICERYGGGGHARVGAISFPPDRGDLARKAAAEIVVELAAADPAC